MTYRGGGLVVCAFPCGYRERTFTPPFKSELRGEWVPEDWTDDSGARSRAVKENVKKYKATKLTINGQLVGEADVSFEKKRPKKKPEPKVDGNRFNVLEFEDDEEET